ncbi:cell division control protein 6 homolog [Pieris napi]|uniref:cell division control protein 6 homolog n=1 Tax=Pieris napi TaxID=78633 RepID=UPI001FB8649A|nr:cell division control protein 6 homolog [Pieris napi]XP_047515375.1 cell division control protein 6 homolog [Pieris napi]
MASVQSGIPFRQRKRTGITDVKRKSNLENENLTNIKPQKRRLSKTLKAYDNDCTPNKVGRLNSITNELNQSFEDDTLLEKPISPLKRLTSREKEIEFLENFLIDHLDNEKSASLYISGQPGTGKTASLSYILQLDKIKQGFKQVYINCTMMKSASSIYTRICNELHIKTSGTTEKACLTAIEKYFNKKHKMILLILDEIDQLDSKRQSVLYTIFEWPAQDYGIVLVGVANALDLTERTLPRLQARCSLRPQTLHFAPYTKEQIINIFTEVLASEDRTNVFSGPALQLLAAKIAAVSGDMRRALDIGRRVVELARRNKFGESKSVDAMLSDSTVTVELKQVLQVLNDVYGGSSKINTEVGDQMPMQQKLILCSIIMLKGKNKEILLGKLHDVYKKVATSRNIASLDLSELCSACGLLESRGALRIIGTGGARSRKLRLNWDETELTAALADKPLMAAILADKTHFS